MNNGYVKLYRKIKEKGWYKNSKYVHLWVHLLLLSSHKVHEFMWNNQIIIIKEGQILTGRKQLSDETGLAQSTIEKILKLFEKEHQIEQLKTTKFRLITIINWKEYQHKEQQKEQQSDNRVTTKEQQSDTYKNDKNDKNDKNNKRVKNNKINSAVAFAPPSLEEVKKYCEENKNTINPRGFIDFYESKGWFVGKNKMKSWRAAVRTWESRSSPPQHETFNLIKQKNE